MLTRVRGREWVERDTVHWAVLHRSRKVTSGKPRDFAEKGSLVEELRDFVQLVKGSMQRDKSQGWQGKMMTVKGGPHAKTRCY